MPDARVQLQALLRDYSAVAESVVFDQDTETAMRDRLDDLLETIDGITLDDYLWRDLRVAGAST